VGGSSSRPVHIIFDRTVGKVFSGRRTICDLGAVVEADVLDLGKRYPVRLVYLGSDNREQRHTLVWAPDWNEAVHQGDLINAWLREYNH